MITCECGFETPAKRLTGNDVEATALAQEALAVLDRVGTLEEPDLAARARG